LSGASTFTGGLYVSGGTLHLTGSLAAGSGVTNSGGTLTGNGTVNGITAISSGTLRPGLGGTDTSTLTINNTLTLARTATFELTRDNVQTASKIAGVPTLTKGGALVVNDGSSSTLQAGDTFTLFSATSSSGSFSPVTLPAVPVPASQNWWTTNNYSTLVL